MGISGHLITIAAGSIVGILLVVGVIFYGENEHARWMPPKRALYGLLWVVYGLGFFGQALWNKILERKIYAKSKKDLRIPIVIKWQGPALIGAALVLLGTVQFLWLWHSS